MTYRIDISPRDPNRYLQTEWLLTNGLGGYAMGTVLGVNTRRYHGLLVAAMHPPVGRVVALHSMIEQLILPRDDGTEEIIDLSTQMFAGPDGEPMLHPGGWTRLREFTCDSQQCVWTFRVGDFLVRRSMALNEQENDVSIRYEIEDAGGPSAARGIGLRVRPLIALRDFHSLDQEPSEFEVQVRHGGLSIERRGTTLQLQCAADFESSAQVWRRFAYVEDRRRGQDWLEDLWSPGEIVKFVSRDSGAFMHISAFVSNRDTTSAARSSRESEQEPLESRDGLVSTASQFIVRRANDDSSTFASILAGYPWFADWGRDAMISLPGLMLCTGRLDEAQSTLQLFARHMRRGLIPNCFDDRGGEPLYNTVDASLWFIHAVHQYHEARAPFTHARSECEPELLDSCREIIAAYRRGTDFNIRMDHRDGLIIAGDATTQLTWMDAKRDGVVFTPRHGKAVEINALWFNALRSVAGMTNDDLHRRELMSLSERVRESFVSQFWWPERNCLHDVLVPVAGSEDEGGNTRFTSDGRLRPNQIFAASLANSMLGRAQQQSVITVVRERLLAPFGLRTLDRDDSGYKGRYDGGMFERDAAYHNGTVWPWLIGPYCEAVLRADDFSGESRAQVRRTIELLLGEMNVQRPPLFRGCLGQVAEVYDGDEPHRPDGCPAQTWSIAELIRIVTMLEAQ